MSGRGLAAIGLPSADIAKDPDKTDRTAAGLQPAELAHAAEAGDMDPALLLTRQLREAGKAEESFKWLLAAAKDGHPIAITKLGLRLIVGHGAPQDPPAGMIAFDNVLGDGSPDKRSLPAGMPVKAGEKWLLSVWIRDRDQPIV